MVAATPENPGDEFDGHQPPITMILPTDGKPSGPMPVQNDGLTEENLPPMPPSPPMPLLPPSFTADPRKRQVVDEINRMQYEHAAKSGEQPTLLPIHEGVALFAKAQARYIRETTRFWRTSGHRDVDDRQYIDLQARQIVEMEIFIHAQMNLLHELGIV